eukprot:UN06853
MAACSSQKNASGTCSSSGKRESQSSSQHSTTRQSGSIPTRFDNDVMSRSFDADIHLENLSELPVVDDPLPSQQQQLIHHQQMLQKQHAENQRMLANQRLSSEDCILDEAQNDEKENTRSSTDLLLSDWDTNIPRVNFFETLPIDMHVLFYDYLDYKSLCNASRVCKEWSTVASDELLWKDSFQRSKFSGIICKNNSTSVQMFDIFHCTCSCTFLVIGDVKTRLFGSTFFTENDKHIMLEQHVKDNFLMTA